MEIQISQLCQNNQHIVKLVQVSKFEIIHNQSEINLYLIQDSKMRITMHSIYWWIVQSCKQQWLSLKVSNNSIHSKINLYKNIFVSVKFSI